MKSCPICKKKLRFHEYYDDRGVEEYIEECTNPKCKGFSNHWAFGYSDFKIGKWESGTFVDHIFVTDKEDRNIAAKMKLEFMLRIGYFIKRNK